MNVRRDVPFVIAPVVALAGLATGNRWLVLTCAAIAWTAIGIGAAGSASRKPVYVGALASFIVAVVDTGLASSAFFVHLRPEIPGVRVAIGVEAIRGALITTSLVTYAALATRLSFVIRSVVTAIVGFGFGFAFEWLGLIRSLWVWNQLAIPNAEIVGIPAFAPVAWGFAFLFAAYFMAESRRQTITGFGVIASGIRCGTGFCASFILCWSLYIRLYGRMTVF